jgi:fibronectin-binding autotransporter adhesin
LAFILYPMNLKNYSFKKASSTLFCALAALAPISSSTLFAADIIKADNSTDMSDPASWLTSVVPGSADVAVFDSTLTSDVNAGFTTNLSFAGIRLSGNAVNVTVSGTSANTLTVGSAGIDLSTAGNGTSLTIDSPTLVLANGVSQTWRAGAGATSTLWGTVTLTGAALTIDATGTNTGSFLAESGSFTAGAASPSVFIKTDTELNFAMPQSGDRKLVSASSVAVSNPSDGGDALVTPRIVAAPASGTFIEMTNSNGMASATAFQAYADINPSTGTLNAGTFWFNSGMRFSQPHATAGTNWVVDMNKIIYANAGGTVSVLVTPGVGARNVIFGGSQVFRFNGAGSNFLFNQSNPDGDLIIRTGFSTTGNNNTHFVKTGPGRLIMANAFGYAANNASARIFINEGTVQLGENTASGSFGDIVIVNNATLRMQRSDAFTMVNRITGTGSLVLASSGSGSVKLTGNNTYTGPTVLQSGGLILGSATALGATSALNVQSGSIAYDAGVASDLSVSPLTLSGNVSIDVGANNPVFANSIGNGGAGGVTKLGSGTLTLAGANNYTGATAISAGAVKVANTGSATGSGDVSVASGAVLTGNGTVSGNVTVAGSAKVTPGDGVGDLTVGGLTLDSGSLLDIELASPSSGDRIIVSGSGGLTINGGGINFYNPANGQGVSTPGTYNLIQYSGVLGGSGVSALSVLNPQAGYRYTFGAAAGFVTLQVDEFGMITDWTSTGSGSFSTAGNWSNGVPTGIGATANFVAASASGSTVSLDGDRTLGGISFNSANSYTIAQGTGGNLTINNDTSSASINVIAGNHTISAPVALTSNLTFTAASASSLTFSGAVSGTSDITKSGAGTLVLSANNTINGSTLVSAGAIEFGSLASLGSGNITLNGGALRYAAGTTEDISSRAINFGSSGGAIDTNGNNITFGSPVGNSSVGSLIKQGAGSLTLAGNNTYAGPTVIRQGSLNIAADVNLNASGVGVTLDGGTLVNTASLSMPRVITVAAGGGTLAPVGNTTFTLPQAITGNGSLNIAGSGTVSIPVAMTKTGGITLTSGRLYVSNGSSAIGSALGTNVVTFAGGTLTSVNSSTSSATSFTNNIVVPTGSNGTINMGNRFALGNNVTTYTVTGNGTLNINAGTTVTRDDLFADFTAFTGNLNFAGSGGIRLFILGGRFGAGFTNASVDLSGSASFAPQTNSTGNPVNIGALSGNSTTAVLGAGSAGAPNYTVGAKGLSTTYAGSMAGNAILTKVGNGTLTLTGNLTNTGVININAGILRVNGNTGSGNVTVGASGTLAGNGTITGNLTVNGKLQPDPTYSVGGRLAVNGALNLTANSTTQFDFSSSVVTPFTKLHSVLNNGLTYGGSLKLNFSGPVYDGTYQLFQITGAPNGSFNGNVTVTTTATTDAPLTNNTGTTGTWDGTVDGATFAFNPSTGNLTVTGATAVATPAIPSGLAATAGNNQVSLTWGAAANADAYIVKRSEVAGGPYVTLISTQPTPSYVDTTAVNGTPYFYVVAARNNNGLVSADSAEVTATPTAVVPRGLDVWREAQFGVNASNPAIAGDNADPDGDGMVNFLEYATNHNPLVSDGPATTVGNNGTHLTLTYRSVADPFITYTVQGVNDISGTPAWGNGTIQTTTGVANTNATVTVTDSQLLSASPRRFLRLNVSYPAAP